MDGWTTAALLDLALWLALLPFLTGLVVVEALTDRLPAAPVFAACLAAAAAVLWTSEPGERVAGGLVTAGVSVALQGLQLAGRGRAGRHQAGGAPRATARWWLEPQAALCAGLVAGWAGAWTVTAAWLTTTGTVAFYLAITGRAADLRRMSFLPFLTLSAAVVFLLQLVPLA